MADGQATIREQVEECWGIGEEFPKFAGEGKIVHTGDGVRGTVAFTGKGSDEVSIHDNVAAVGIKMAFGKFDGFTNHDAHGDISEAFLIGHAKGVADVVAIVYECLRREIGKARAEVLFAFRSRVDDQLGAAKGSGYPNFFPYGIDKGLG